MVNIVLAKRDPASIFKSPHKVVEDKSLSAADKIDILRRWAYEERELEVAEEENMVAKNNHRKNYLDEVLKSLRELGVEGDQNYPPPTKQG